MMKRIQGRLNLCRIKHPATAHINHGDSFNGAFKIAGPRSRILLIVASNGQGWDHVSVSIVNSTDCPSWDEMCYVRELFFQDSETVIQLHPPKELYINFHPGTLHLWRNQNVPIQLPQRELV